MLRQKALEAALVVTGLTATGCASALSATETPPHDRSLPIIGYHGRPYIPGSKFIDRVTQFGNVSLQLYDGHGQGNYADASFFISKDKSIDAVVTCDPDKHLKIIQEYKNMPTLFEDHMPRLHYTDTSSFASTACAAGQLTIASIHLLDAAPQGS